MLGYFSERINERTQEEYIAGNISDAEAVFSLSDEELEKIAFIVVRDLEEYFDDALKREKEVSGNGKFSTLAIYLRDIRRYRDVNPFETLCLARSVELGDFATGIARNNMICSYLEWAYNIAKHFAFYKVDLLDLIQTASIGLVNAIDKWKMQEALTQGSRFVTYAAYRVKGAILDCIREGQVGSSGISVPRSIQKVKATIKTLEKLLMYWKMGAPFPDLGTLAKLSGASRATVLSAIGQSAFLRRKLKADEYDSQDPIAHLFKDGEMDLPYTPSVETSSTIKRVKRMIEWLFRAWEGDEPFPDVDTLADFLGTTIGTVVPALYGAMLSIDAPVEGNDDGDNDFLGMLIASDRQSAEDESNTYFDSQDQLSLIRCAIDQFHNGRHRARSRDGNIIKIWLGFMDLRDKSAKVTMKNIGMEVSVNESRISQIIKDFCKYVAGLRGIYMGPNTLKDCVLAMLELVDRHEAKYAE